MANSSLTTYSPSPVPEIRAGANAESVFDCMGIGVQPRHLELIRWLPEHRTHDEYDGHDLDESGGIGRSARITTLIFALGGCMLAR